jgi:Cellulase (glycosyl hydrolase family 5)
VGDPAGTCSTLKRLLLVSAALLALAAPSGAQPASRMFVGFQDELALRYGHDRQQMLDVAWHANATVIRAWIEWDKIAPTRPAHPRDPFDPAYVMTDTDDLVRAAQMRGMEVLFTIWGTPPWANHGAAENRAPTAAKDLEDFSYAIAARYSGRYIGYPFVRFYTVWNEPNQPAFLSPQYDSHGRSVSPRVYARLYRAGYRGIKAANPLAQVALGDTSPWGSAVAGSHPPGRFAELLSRMRPRLRFDAWAHHPYATSPDLPPTQLVRWPNVTMSQLPRLERQLGRWFGRRSVPIWITEYDYRTRPQDLAGVTYAQQALYLGRALRMAAADPAVTMFVWYVLRDDPQGPWSSGLIAENGLRKPSFRVFVRAAKALDARDAIVRVAAGRRPWVHVSARDVSYYDGVGAAVGINYSFSEAGGPVRGAQVATTIGRDDWLRFPLAFRPRAGHTYSILIRGSDIHGNRVRRTLTLVTR